MNPVTGPVSLALACHPRTPSLAIRRIDVVAGAMPGGGLSLSFALEGELSGLRIPEPRPTRRVDGLWRHTCFEAFVMVGEGPGYREFNFSPSGEWAIHTFRSYREGDEPDGELNQFNPGIAVRCSGDRLELEAQIPTDFLPPGDSLRLGLSAVIEDANGGHSHWALRHPPGKPDFHHIDAFALPLVLPEMPDGDTPTGRVRP